MALDADARALDADGRRHEAAGRLDAAFTAYVEAARAFLHVARSAQDAPTRQAARTGSTRALERAQKIRAVRGDLQAPSVDVESPEAQLRVLQRGAVVNGVRLRDARDAGVVPLPEPTLSRHQVEAEATWIEPRHLECAATLLDDTIRPEAIRQHAVPNCSLVAGLIVCYDHARRFGSNLHLRCLIDPEAATTAWQGPGSIEIAMHVNGMPRHATISNRLPVDASGRLMTCTAGKGLWAPLIEKAFLTLMGGYEFGGSFSCADLQCVGQAVAALTWRRMLTGWLPEIYRLRSAEFRSESAWRDLSSAFARGDCVLTAGTGSAPIDRPGLPLISRHDYAILAMAESSGRRLVTVANPWRRDERLADTFAAMTVGERADVFVLEWREFCALFATIHANWDPARFPSRSTLHVCVCRTSYHAYAAAHGRRVDPSQADTVLVLVSAHLPAVRAANDYLALQCSPIAGDEGPSPQDRVTPARSILDQRGLSVIVDRRGASSSSFTLEVFSARPVALKACAQPVLRHTSEIAGAWSSWSAGGSHVEATYPTNPQFAVRPAPGLTATVTIDLEAPKGLAMNMKLFRGAQRLSSLTDRTLSADSGLYTGAPRLTRVRVAEPSVLVCSTFSPSVEADFKLRLRSDAALTVAAVPSEGAGMFVRQLRLELSAANVTHVAIDADASTIRLIARTLTLRVSRQPTIAMQLYDRGSTIVPLVATSPSASSFGPCDVRVPRDGLLLAVRTDSDATAELTVHLSVPARLRVL